MKARVRSNIAMTQITNVMLGLRRGAFFRLLEAVHRLYNVVALIIDVSGILSSAKPLLLVEYSIFEGESHKSLLLTRTIY